MNMKRFLSIFFVLPLVFVSCDLTMDEVSQDVNKPTQVHPKTILTQLCITTFGIEYYGVQPYRLAWQWDQRGGGGHFNFQRRNFISEYRRVTWCYDMVREAERLNDPRYIHLAAYFRASWIFDTTRLFGDVPYTEAAQGRFDDPNFSPKYDPQEEIVAGLLRELAAANEALGDYDNTKIDGDVIFGGDIRKWRQLINLYRLRILINCSMKQTIAGERVGELFAGIVGDPEGHPIMGALSDNAIRDEKGNMENYKYYNDNNFVSSYRISKFVVDWMRERGDMRLPKLAEMMIKLDGKNADPTDLANYKGVIPNPGATGDNNNTDMENGSQSRLKSKWYLEPVGPSAMNIGYPEQEFILAEAALRGWTDDDPETHYLNGIRAAHEFLGVSSADTRAYLGHEKVQFKGSDTEKLGKIITEKYLNFFMQGGNEAYFELRRTGYPDFSAYLTHNTDQIYNDGYLPLRYRYPQSEIDNNNAQVSEAIKRLDKGDDRNSRMWLLQGSDPLFNPAPFPFRYKN